MSQVQPFSVSRVLNAPRALVWQVHTDAAHMSRWMSPAGFKVVKADLDLRPGGRYHYCQEAPNGMRMWGRQTFREVTPPERLVYLQSFSDENGGVTRHPMSPTWPLEMLATVTFEAVDERRTRLTISWAPHESDAVGEATFDGARSGMEQGFGGMLAQLEQHLADSGTEILSSRWLRTPRERVWQALTDPAQVNQWWGPNGFRNVDVEQDVRVGGVWRFKMIGPDGTVYPNRVVYHELTPPSRIVYDHGDDQRVHFQAVITLDEEAGGTRISLGLRFPTREERDAVIRFGAIEGGQQTLAKLDAYLAR